MFICLFVGVYRGKVRSQNPSVAAPIVPALDRKDGKNKTTQDKEKVDPIDLGPEKGAQFGN